MIDVKKKSYQRKPSIIDQPPTGYLFALFFLFFLLEQHVGSADKYSPWLKFSAMTWTSGAMCCHSTNVDNLHKRVNSSSSLFSGSRSVVASAVHYLPRNKQQSDTISTRSQQSILQLNSQMFPSGGQIRNTESFALTFSQLVGSKTQNNQISKHLFNISKMPNVWLFLFCFVFNPKLLPESLLT